MAHIRYDGPGAVLDALTGRYPALAAQKEDIRALYALLRQAFASGGKLLVCGNGGSAADALHIVGELMKSFTLPRPVDEAAAAALAAFGEEGRQLASSLEGALPAVALVENAALSTALENDVSGGLSFAQQVYGLGQPGDVLLCISTSGNARNAVAAAMVARARGLRVALLSGGTGGRLKALSDASVVVDATETFMIQELHLPVYHALCLMLEYAFFPPAQ